MTTLWVEYNGDERGWCIWTNKTRLVGGFRTKVEAVKGAQIIGRVMKCELFIRNKDGRVSDRRSYGNDPKGRG